MFRPLWPPAQALGGQGSGDEHRRSCLMPGACYFQSSGRHTVVLLPSFQNGDGPPLRSKILAGSALHVLRRDLLQGRVEAIHRVDRAGRRDERHHRLGRVPANHCIRKPYFSCRFTRPASPHRPVRLEPPDRRFHTFCTVARSSGCLTTAVISKQRRVAAHRHAGGNRLGLLLVEDELLVGIAGGAERQLGQELGGHVVAIVGVEAVAAIGQVEDRQRLAGVGDLGLALRDGGGSA